MAGPNDNLVYPVLDLIKRELKDQLRDQALKSKLFGGGDDPFGGHPSIELERNHPQDYYQVTGSTMRYESGYSISINLGLGSDYEEQYPDPEYLLHYDKDYYRNWRLSEVSISAFNESLEQIGKWLILLNYDKRGLLINTETIRIV